MNVFASLPASYGPTSNSSLTQSASWISRIAILLLLSGLSYSQDPNAGIIPFSTHKFGIDLATSNINIIVPVRSKVGKIPFSYSIISNSQAYQNGSAWSVATGFYGVPTGPSQLLQLRITYTQSDGECVGNGIYWYAISLVDATGALHPLPRSFKLYPTCGSGSLGPVTTTDGSGYTLVVTDEQKGPWTVYDSSGNSVDLHATMFQTSWSEYDSDSVPISVSYSGAVQTYTDTLNATPIVATQNYSNEALGDTYKYTDINGGTQEYTVSYSHFTNLGTAFNCTGITEWAPGSMYLPTTIATPGGNYTISYESTTSGYTGRISKIVYPTGGYIKYSYSGGNSGINCASGVVPTLTVAVNDNNSNTNTWTFTNSNSGSSSPNFSVVETDPASNQTVHFFSGEYQTEALSYKGGCPTTYSGCTGGGSPLTATITCYNGNNSSQSACVTPSSSPGSPYQTDVYSVMYSADGSTSSISLETTIFDCKNTPSACYNLPIEIKRYDWGQTFPPSGSPVFDTVITYDGMGGTSCGTLTSQAHDRVCSVTTTSGGATVNQTTYTYNATGHPIQTQGLVSGTTSLTSSASYNTNGTVATSTDPAGSVTNYYYNGTGGCSGVLPTSTTSGGLTISMQWNCDGGVETQVTDTNNNVTKYGYVNVVGGADPLWRLLSTTDPFGNVVWKTYTAATLTTFATGEAALTFPAANPTSTSDVLSTVDGLGRLLQSQIRTAPGATTFDNTVRYGYGWNTTGAFTTQTIEGGTAKTTTQSDAVGRTVSVQDGGGGTVAMTYSLNDALNTLSPAPAGENNKQMQNEFDGLGRIIKSCAIGDGSGTACGQNTGSANGVTTSFSYTSASGSTTTRSTRGSQSRTRTYDALGRVTQSVTPEGGTVTFTYDSNSGCPGSINGYLTAVNMPANGWCIYRDSLGRVTNMSASYSGTGTACRHFYYDNSTGYSGTIPSGITVNNGLGRIVEAATDDCSGTNLQTDFWFSYDKDGRTTDMWEKTPNSGIYYHSVATFFSNGAIQTLHIANPNKYTQTYTLDGEGRWTSLSSSQTSETVVSATTYNAASQPTNIAIGSGTDYDGYVYDPNTGRMTNWTFQVGTTPKQETAILTWNPNGTLQELAISDGFNSGGTQTCNYNPTNATGTGYDDLGRLVGVDCGSGGWGQTFSYDQYDNLTKAIIAGRTGTTFNPGYNSANNHFASGFGASYDSNGNLTNDTFHIYEWNEFSKLKSVDRSGTNCATSGECLVYDAFGRVVEIDSGSTKTEILYTQLGKTGYFNGSTLNYAYWPTPGGGTLLQNPGSFYYEHKDWLRSARISSAVSNETIIDDRAFSPYGELYATFGSTAQNENIFTGDTQDIVSGTYDTPNRELNIVGRWISPDPAGAGWNQYAYAPNPNSFTDPSGLCPNCDDPHYASLDARAEEPSCFGGPGCTTYVLDGMEVSASVAQAWLSGDAAVNCGSLCDPVHIQGKGWAFPSYGDDPDSASGAGISWTFSFTAKDKGYTLTNEALAEMLGLPTGTPIGFGPQYQNTIVAPVGDVFHRLKAAKCDAFFGGAGDKTLESMIADARFSWGMPSSTGATQDIPGLVIFNGNPNGFFMSPLSFMPQLGIPNTLDAIGAQGFEVAHELAHDLVGSTGFLIPDASGNPGGDTNRLINNMRLTYNCFQ